MSNKKYSINSSELKNLINRVVRERKQPDDNFYTTFDTIYFEQEPKDLASPYGLNLYLWIAIKKDKLYQIAKESIERYGSGMLNFKDKPTVISASGLKYQYPNTFIDVYKEKFQEIFEMESENEKSDFSELLEFRKSASIEIDNKRKENPDFFLMEEELGFEYLELFFNDGCNCERPNYHEHLAFYSNCLKTREQITEFKNKALEIMDRKIREKNRRKTKTTIIIPNNNHNPRFENNYDPSLSNFKNITCKEIIKKRSEIATKYQIYLSENDLSTESNYKNCFGCSHSWTSCADIDHIWQCLNSESEVKTFKNQIISVLEQIYREKSGKPNIKKLSEEEIREKASKEEEKQQEKNKNNSLLPPTKDKTNSDKNQEDKKNDLISEIKKLKQEIRDLKNKPNKTSQQQKKLAEKENKLWALEKKLGNHNTTTQNPKSDNKFPTGWVVGGIILVIVVGTIATLVINKKKKK